jgi:Fe-S-cluster containining protein
MSTENDQNLKKSKPKVKTKTMECRRCGVCCTMHQAFVNPKDIDRILKYLGITEKDWEELYDDPRWRYSEYRLIRQIDGACAFLRFSGGLAECAIHDVKPECCAKWQAGPEKKECKEGMAKLKG